MMHQDFNKDQAYTETAQWWPGPWGREENMKPLQDFKKSRAFEKMEPKWERTAAVHFLKMYEHAVLLWVVNRSKDQRSFDIEITGERVGPSLFNLDPLGRLLEKGKLLRKLATQATLERNASRRMGAEKFRARHQGMVSGEQDSNLPADNRRRPPREGAPRSAARNPLEVTQFPRGARQQSAERLGSPKRPVEESSSATAPGSGRTTRGEMRSKFMEQTRTDWRRALKEETTASKSPSADVHPDAWERAGPRELEGSPGEIQMTRTPNFQDNFDELEALNESLEDLSSSLFNNEIEEEKKRCHDRSRRRSTARKQLIFR